MKNLLTAIIIIFITNLSLADYMVKVPLEINGGGGLPNGSINIGDSSSVPPPSGNIICVNDYDNWWFEETDGPLYASFGGTTVIEGDSRFSRGNFVQNYPEGIEYEICGPSELLVPAGELAESPADPEHPNDGCVYSENPNTIWVFDQSLGWHWVNGYYVQYQVPGAIFWNGTKVFDFSEIADPTDVEYQDMYVHIEGHAYYTKGNYQKTVGNKEYWSVCLNYS